MNTTDEILKTFYEQLVTEAAVGKVDCGVIYNTLFNTSVLENNQTKILAKANDYDDLMIPTLNIKDQQKFNDVLEYYVLKAREFYTIKEEENNNFDKTVMALLFCNATIEDFNDPVMFIKKHINFIENDTLNKYIDEKDMGYIGILNSNMLIKVNKDVPSYETPYSVDISFVNKTEDKLLKYNLPTVRLGINGDTASIYAVQRKKEVKEDLDQIKYEKKINRLLYKVNENFTEESESIDNIENPHNLTGITPSALIASTIAVGLLSKEGINKIEVPAMLLVRYNAKEIMYKRKIEHLKKIGKGNDEIDEVIKEFDEQHQMIKRNASDKFIRNFRRINYHFNGIKITTDPFVVDSKMHLINKHDKCNNPLLNEVYEKVQNYSEQKKL